MSSLTQRFGLSRFGGNAGGSIGDDGQKYSLRDRDFIDGLLAALESHDHRGTGVALASPTDGPVVSVGSGGSLPGGTRVYYRTSFVDQYGLETEASPEVAVATPSPINAPSPPAVSASGTTGGLPVGGGYLYALSTVVVGDATNPSASVLGQTEISQVGSVTLQAYQTAVLSLPALPDVVPSRSNFVPNPNADLDLAGWTASAHSTLTRETVDSVIRTHSFGLVHAAGDSTADQGAVLATISGLVSGTQTFSMYVRLLSGAGETYRLKVVTDQGTYTTDFTPSAQWTRVSVPAQGTTATCRIVAVGTGNGSKLLFAAVQLETGTLSPYIDGGLGVGYSWSGTPYESASARTAGVGTVGYYVYRQGPGEAGLSALVQSGAPVFVTGSTYADDGSASPDPSRPAPFVNSTSASNAIQAVVQGLPANARSWRLYRSFAPGEYSTQSLVHEVTEGVPGATNYMINPEAATDLTGWGFSDSVGGASLVRRTDQSPPVGAGATAYFQRAAGARTRSDIWAAITDGKVRAGKTYALTVYASWDGAGTAPAASLFLGDSGGVTDDAPASAAVLLTTTPQRLTMVFTALTDLPTLSVAMLRLDTAASACGVIVTGWQLEDNVVTPYVKDVRLPQLATSYLDTGGSLFDGTPLEVSNTFGAPKPVQLPVYTTALRPPAFDLGKGAAYWDDTLHKPVWSDGTIYRDATGTSV